jgi:hypothetical protein
MKEILFTVILPVHTLDGIYEDMLKNAVSSVEDFHNDVNLMIVYPNALDEKIKTIPLSDKLNILYTSHNLPVGDFCSQVNFGIEKCETTWFSILEIDDQYKPIWLKSMNEYLNTYKDVDVFLPIVKDINVEGNFISFTNESAWAYGFTERQGFIDNEVLLEFQNYQISGGLYKTKTIKDNGSLKENIKLTFGYEFLLRLTHNGVKIMTVPHIGYEHLNLREDSLFWSYKNDEKNKLSQDEVKFWLDTAKKEFFFKNKRDVNYVKV